MHTLEADGQPSVTAKLSNAIVQVVKQHTGRGPTRARTVIAGDFVACVMHDTLTTAEQTLVDAGRAEDVLLTRKQLQGAMRESVIGVVENLTGRKVIAFMSDNNIDPDMAVEAFVLEPAAENGAGGS
jgi:uncharacterized protein YbcI